MLSLLRASSMQSRRDFDSLPSSRVIGSRKSARRRSSRVERVAAHRSHLQKETAVIRLSTGHHRVEEQRAGGRGAEGPHGAMGLPKFLPSLSLSLALFLPSLSLSFSPVVRCRHRASFVVSSDAKIRPGHVVLNWSIISQSLSQRITFAVLEASVLARNPSQTLPVVFLGRAHTWTRSGKRTRVCFFLPKQSCRLEILRRDLAPRTISSASCLFITKTVSGLTREKYTVCRDRRYT